MQLTLLTPPAARTPRQTIDALIAEHGAIRVLIAAATALIRHPQPRRPSHAGDLSNHLRRDIGLAPAARPPTDWRPIL